MMQERLVGLLLIVVERKILKTDNSDAIIDELALSSAELSRALLCR